MGEFEKWLRLTSFQKPTPEAFDLAKAAWECGGTKALNDAADFFFEQWEGRKPPHEILRAMTSVENRRIQKVDAGDTVKDTERLEWLMRNVSGEEFCRLGVTYGGKSGRDRIDAAMMAHNAKVTGSPALSASPCGLPGYATEVKK